MLGGGDPTRLMLPNSRQTPKGRYLARLMSRTPRPQRGRLLRWLGLLSGSYLHLQSIWASRR